VLVAALATGIGAIVALIWLPARARDENLAEQAAEYAAEHVGDEGAPTNGQADVTTSVEIR
jgi:hypothetical protein